MIKKERLLPDGDVHRRIQQMLINRMSELTTRIKLIEEEHNWSADGDEPATERADEDALDAVEQAALVEIDQIRNALRRLRDGSYGRCISCGEAIDPRRLLVMPAAGFCVICAAAAGE